jgi:propanol-preferring alcohol dehydrogenase
MVRGRLGIGRTAKLAVHGSVNWPDRTFLTNSIGQFHASSRLGKAMRAMVLTNPGPLDRDRLELRDLPVPEPANDQVLVKVVANAVCRTDLHVVEGELPQQRPALVPGHQIVGRIEALGPSVKELERGDRVGIPWLGSTCGQCIFCLSGRENLCEKPVFTGYHVDGGYAEYALARAAFTFRIPDPYSDVEASPLLCAGLIGYRSLRRAEVRGLSGPGRLGLFGFGSSAHIVIQVARELGHEVYVYTRGTKGQALAVELGAAWAGGGEQLPPVELDSVIIFAPAGELVPHALRSIRKGGVVVCAGIHMSPIPQFAYELLWGERELRSVANLTRRDGHEFLALVREGTVRPEVEVFPLEQANAALRGLKSGELRGTAVLVP